MTNQTPPADAPSETAAAAADTAYPGEPACWTNAVVYQIYPRSFADADGDGVGDLRGIIDHLDHLATLGVDVVWLSPIYRSPQADNGYDISDYQDIDPLFGTMADFDELLDGLHERGIKLMMDLVVNHTSDEHQWFVESRSSTTSQKRDWYVWRHPREGHEPNNWGSFFSGSAWQLDELSGQYYLHLFDVKQPDLNWENPEVRQAVYAMMRWWLDKGVDGFRMDVINFISKVAGLPDAPPVEGHEFVNAFAMFADGPRIHEFLAEMHREVFAGRPGQFVTVGETPGVTTEQAVLYTDPQRAELDMVFQFEHVSLDQSPTDKFAYAEAAAGAVKASLYRWQEALGATGWNSLYWDNHDQPRAVSRFGDDDPQWWAASAKTIATILHGLRGTPYVYQGEEIGMTNYPFAAPADFRDVEVVNYLAALPGRGIDVEAALHGIRKITRDNARTPVQWDGSRYAGFSSAAPWLPVNPNASWLNAEAQVDVPGSVFEHYRALIVLRKTLPVLAIGHFEALEPDPGEPGVWAYTRSLAGARLLVVANAGREHRTVEVGADWSGARLVLGSETGAQGALTDSTVSLAGWESRIYLLG